MIAIVNGESARYPLQSWQSQFLKMLPEIEKRLWQAFRFLDGEARAEAVQEGVTFCLVSFERLARQGRPEAATVASLVQFAIKRLKSGRTVATRLNVRDPLSRYAQQSRGYRVDRLDCYDNAGDRWIESLIADRQAPVLEQVLVRLDVPQWLARLKRRTRCVARDLALGWSTAEVAHKYHLSVSRISQIRRELVDSWRKFQGEAMAATATA